MAQVFLAIDPRRTGVHRLVALKTLRDRVADSEEHLAMFHDEAHIASLIHHPNVCRVMDYGFARGRPFLAMEYVCGENLRAVHDRFAKDGPDAHRLPAAERVARMVTLVAEAARGLHATHELRAVDGDSIEAVHRDVTPDNILVSCGGTVKVVDFGLVKAVNRRHQTETGILKGKVAYVAPEGVGGRPVDRRADVFSLGAILWELLVGERLFRRESDYKTLEAIMHGEVRPPSEVRSDLPAAFDELVLAALSRDTEARPQTARAFANRLTRCANAAGLSPDVFDLEAFVHEHFEHDATCLQRGLRDAESILPPPALSTDWLAVPSERLPSVIPAPAASEVSVTPLPPSVSSTWVAPMLPPPPSVPALCSPSEPADRPSLTSISATPPPVWSTITSSHVVLPAAALPAPTPAFSRKSWLAVAAIATASAALVTLLAGLLRDDGPPRLASPTTPATASDARPPATEASPEQEAVAPRISPTATAIAPDAEATNATGTEASDPTEAQAACVASEARSTSAECAQSSERCEAEDADQTPTVSCVTGSHSPEAPPGERR